MPDIPPIYEVEDDIKNQSYLLCFSWIKSHKEFAWPRSKQNEDDSLLMFEGFWVLSLWWILALEMLLIFLTFNIWNLAVAYWIINLYIYALIRSATFGFDVLVFMMVITNFLYVRSYYKSHKGINILDYAYLVFRRVIKILPVFYMLFFALWVFMPYISNSPNWFANELNWSSCKSTWIWNVLFIGNLVPWTVVPFNSACFYWSFWIFIDV